MTLPPGSRLLHKRLPTRRENLGVLPPVAREPACGRQVPLPSLKGNKEALHERALLFLSLLLVQKHNGLQESSYFSDIADKILCLCVSVPADPDCRSIFAEKLRGILVCRVITNVDDCGFFVALSSTREPAKRHVLFPGKSRSDFKDFLAQRNSQELTFRRLRITSSPPPVFDMNHYHAQLQYTCEKMPSGGMRRFS